MEDDWNNGYYIEAMDRLHTVATMAEVLLDSHPAIEKCGLQEKLERAIQSIYDIYQDIGAYEYAQKGLDE